jgi:hypothetical protein
MWEPQLKQVKYETILINTYLIREQIMTQTVINTYLIREEIMTQIVLAHPDTTCIYQSTITNAYPGNEVFIVEYVLKFSVTPCIDVYVMVRYS